MQRVARPFAFVVLASVALLAAGCSDNAKKIVGKWKLVSMTKDGKEEQAPPGSDAALIEFTADGNMNLVMDLSGLPPEVKAKLEQDKEGAGKLASGLTLGKYKVSGSTIELTPTENSGGGLFGKKGKGKDTARIKIDGDNMTLSGDDGDVKLTRVK